MKHAILSLCLLCAFAAAKCQTQPGSVGIHTENPKGILHVDGASTPATTNPPSGEVSPLQASDDVVIDADGNLGIGIIAPQAKVDIHATTPGGALRIRDGTQGARKVLTSLDSYGSASWTVAPGSWWYAALHSQVVNVGSMNGYTGQIHTFKPYSDGVVSVEDEGSISKTDGTITVPYTGKYRIMICANTISYSTPTYWARTILHVTPAGSSIPAVRWTPSVWGAQSGAGLAPTFTTVVELDEGDVLSIALDATQTFNAHWGRAKVFLVEYIP
jgi:hypothetical protein